MAYAVLTYNTLTRLVFMMRFNVKAMPTNDTDYSCHIKAVEFIQPITWDLYHTTSLGGTHARVHTHTCMHAQAIEKSNF